MSKQLKTTQPLPEELRVAMDHVLTHHSVDAARASAGEQPVITKERLADSLEVMRCYLAHVPVDDDVLENVLPRKQEVAVSVRGEGWSL